MKQKLIKLLLSCFVATATTHATTPYYPIRSQSVVLSRQLIGITEIEKRLSNSEACWPGFIGATLEYDRSFDAKSISQCLFGDCLLNNGCCQAIKISGSQVTDRAKNDWLADYFGLPTNYQGIINLNPRISSTVGDFQAYLRLDRYLCGLYFYIHAPVVHTKWDLNVCEDVIVTGSSSYTAGYFAPDEIARDNLVATAGDFLSGRATPNLGDDVTFNKLAHARWDIGNCCNNTKNALADLRFWLGYDWRGSDCYNLGIGLVVAAPTGNAPNGDYFFEPVIGNGSHWELGGLARAHFTFWQNCDNTARATFYTQANITHLFDAQQCRTFDLCGKPNSRYMLAERMGDNTSILFSNPIAGDENPATTTAPSHQFAGEFTTVANLTTLCVDVSANVQVDWVAMATYANENFTWDLGYELWYRSCENIKPHDCSVENLIPANTWALKGDSFVYGFANADVPNTNIMQGDPVALSATQSQAGIKAGTNNGSSINTGVDNSQFALVGAANTDVELVIASPLNQQKTSNEPVFITSSDINLCGAGTKGLSNKIFTHVSYFWDCECWQPFLGFGAMGEFGTNTSCNKDYKNSSSSDDCQTCSLSQWGIWVKGGFVFG